MYSDPFSDSFAGSTGAQRRSTCRTAPAFPAGDDVQILFECRLADTVVNDVDTFAAGEPLYLRLKILLGEDDDFVGFHLAREFRFFIARDSSDHAGADRVGHLHNDQANASGRGVD